MISPKETQEDFIDWVKDFQYLTEGEVIAIDGKTIRASCNKLK